ncbi:MAG TPA: efflux RND transporter periplasmic adaptor subunit [Anaerolineales bacterium]|nr:efflux RND transporter periplasmic adaptor subunit [Anaerolineales bacterium]
MKRKTSKHKLYLWTTLSIALIIAFGSAIYYFTSGQSSTKENILQTSTISTGDIILSATGLGTLVPSQEVSFGFKNGGEIQEVLVSLGDQVEAGQVLAHLENETLTLKYKQAEANLAALSSPSELASAAQAMQEAKQSFAEARNKLQYLIGPDMLVAEEQVAAAQQDLQAAKSAFEEDASDANGQKLSEAEASLTKAQVNLSYAYYNFSDAYTLNTFTYPIRNDHGITIRRDLIAPTDAELLAARAAYELAASNLFDAQNYLDILNGVKTTDAVPASSVTSLTEAKLALDKAKADLDATELIAPTRGTVTMLSLNPGDEAGTSSVITISNTDQPYVIDASLDETDWDKAKVGFDATVTFDLLPNDTYSGKIVQVYPKLDDSSGTSMVHILVQLDQTVNVDLPVGSSASVDVTGGEALGVVLVPISALQEIEDGTYMVYLMKNGTPVEQTVEIGLQDILYAEVKSGLQSGDVVVTDVTTVDSNE